MSSASQGWVAGSALLAGTLVVAGCGSEVLEAGTDVGGAAGNAGASATTTSSTGTAHTGTGGVGGAGGDAGAAGGAGGAGGGGGVGHYRWSQRFGGPEYQVAGTIALDSSDDIVLGGAFQDSIDLGGGVLTNPDPGHTSDMFLAKLDPAGQHLWSERFGDEDHQVGSIIAVDAWDDILVTSAFRGTVDFGAGPLTSAGGAVYGDICLAKLDAEGAHRWSKRFGDGDDQGPTRVAVDVWGAVLLVGFFAGTIDFGGATLVSAGGSEWTAADIFVAKLDPDGNHIWSCSFGDPSGQTATAVATASAGDVVVVGQFDGTVSFGGAPLTSAGGSGLLGGDIFVVKLDADGNHVWSQRFGDASTQWATDVALDGSGNIVLVGMFQGELDLGGGTLVSATDTMDGFVAKLDRDGNHLWSFDFGDAEDDLAYDVALDDEGSMVLGGSFGGTIDLGGGALTSAGGQMWGDALVAQLDAASGAHQFGVGFGDPERQCAVGVARDSAGDIVALGNFEGTVDFGGGPLTSADEFDVFLVKLAP